MSRRFVEKILPLLSSLALHGAVLLLGLLTYRAIVTTQWTVTQTEAVTSDIGFDADGLTGGPVMPDAPEGPTRDDLVPPDVLIPQEGNGVPAKLGSPEGGDGAGVIEASGFARLGTGAGVGRIGLPGGGPGGTGAFGIPNGHPDGSRDGTSIFAPPKGGGGARSVAFVCDASGSMLTNFDALREQIRRSVTALRPVQSFNVIFFQGDGAASVSPGLLPATAANKARAEAFLDDAIAVGTTDPLPALKLAFDQRPGVIFLLTDGDFPDNHAVIGYVRKRNAGRAAKERTVVCTIAFVTRGESYEDVLKTIASENGGTFRYVDEGDLD